MTLAVPLINRLFFGIPPAVVDADVFNSAIPALWKDTETAWSVSLEFHRDPSAVEAIGARKDPIFAAYDRLLSHAHIHHSLIAREDGEPVVSYTLSAYDLGETGFSEYIDEHGFYRGDEGEVRIKPPASYLAHNLMGRVAFVGNVWLRPDRRSGGATMRNLIDRVDLIGRMIAVHVLDCRVQVVVVRKRHFEDAFVPRADVMVPGASYWHNGEEPLMLGTTNARSIKREVHDLVSRIRGGQPPSPPSADVMRLRQAAITETNTEAKPTRSRSALVHR